VVGPEEDAHVRIVAGVDGCPRGWIAAVWGPDGVEWRVTPLSFEALLRALPDAERIAVDVPIGCGPSRLCDAEAKAMLGPARSSVFPIPAREVLEAPTYADALAVAAARGEKGISIQTWYIKDRVLDATAHAAADSRVVEAHPEVSFLRLAEVPLPPKKSAAGVGARLAVLGKVFGDVPALLATCPRPATADDALDALACAWTARRLLEGTAQRLGNDNAAIWF
jgi:predicted RNase H-like nuclease